MKWRQGNVFMPVCDSVHRGGLVSQHATTGRLTRGVSVQGCLNLGGLCMRVSVSGSLCPGGSLCKGSLVQGSLSPAESQSRGVSVQVVSVQGSLCPGGLLGRHPLRQRPPYSNKLAVRILLECILLVKKFSK